MEPFVSDGGGVPAEARTGSKKSAGVIHFDATARPPARDLSSTIGELRDRLHTVEALLANQITSGTRHDESERENELPPPKRNSGDGKDEKHGRLNELAGLACLARQTRVD